jgi:hypothetical protein
VKPGFSQWIGHQALRKDGPNGRIQVSTAHGSLEAAVLCCAALCLAGKGYAFQPWLPLEVGRAVQPVPWKKKGKGTREGIDALVGWREDGRKRDSVQADHRVALSTLFNPETTGLTAPTYT